MRNFLIVFFLIFAFTPRARAQTPCPATDFADWLVAAATGREDVANAALAKWRSACACADDDAACIAIPVESGERAVSPAQLSVAAAQAAKWVRSTRAFCAGVSGGDDDRIAARACWERRAAAMTGIDDALPREILAVPIAASAPKLAEEESFVASPPSDTMMSDPSAGSDHARRAKTQADELAAEICVMRAETERLRERLDNMRRQPLFIRGEQEPRINATQNELRRIGDALERARGRFEMFAGRSFDPLRDCAPAKPEAPKPNPTP
ncbi:MAG: hypothetical protein IT350_00035 [Deltaproteobacteria bacterium]|nr:hypothetical protein [Deltaproteobacteria bacterium]